MSAPDTWHPEVLDGTPYRGRGILGQGGMAMVIDAEATRDGHRVVVKMLRARAASNDDLAARLRAEAVALLELEHPNLVEVLDWGVTPAGRGYIVMERLRGHDLRAELKAQGALAPSLALEIARQALAGLEALHRRGIVHRDVKPANIFLCDHPDGGLVVKLLDLGVAKITAPAEIAAASERRRTAPGEILGTPWFVPPEMLQGRPVTPASDVYAMGATLYQMLTGKHPFAGCRSIDELWQAHLFRMPPAPSALASQPLSPALDRVVLRAMAKQPRERHASATELAADLARVAAAPMRLSLAERGATSTVRDRADDATLPDATADTVAASASPASATEPHTTRPHTTQPHTTQPHTTQPHATQPQPTPPQVQITPPHTTQPQATLASPTWQQRVPAPPPAQAPAMAPPPAPPLYVPPAARSGRRGLAITCLLACVIGGAWHLLDALLAIPRLVDPLDGMEVPPAVARDAFAADVVQAHALAQARDVLLIALAAALSWAAFGAMRAHKPGRAFLVLASTAIAAALALDLASIVPRMAFLRALETTPDVGYALPILAGFVSAAWHALLVLTIRWAAQEPS